jgi:hypothetical protein
LTVGIVKGTCPGSSGTTSASEGCSGGVYRERRKMHRPHCVVGNKPGVPSPPLIIWANLEATFPPWRNEDNNMTTYVLDVSGQT